MNLDLQLLNPKNIASHFKSSKISLDTEFEAYFCCCVKLNGR